MNSCGGVAQHVYWPKSKNACKKKKVNKILIRNCFKIFFTTISLALYCYCNESDKSKNKISQEEMNVPIGNNLNIGKRSKEKNLTRMQLIINGHHNCDEINNAVFKNLSSLRIIYNKRLKDNPGITGWIGFQFIINENGKVIKTEIIETTVNDDILKDSIKKFINTWTFTQIKPNDPTAVYFPFCCGSFCDSYNEIICNGKIIKNIKEN
ncbi:MAG TPA: AgmX/PglI C-terminal domain-containing protein [Chitinispirillaceae bacterium]|nr:AgmX/PglI C-terminal domain-containing protein [Chitinispirillaceae bacterium]